MLFLNKNKTRIDFGIKTGYLYVDLETKYIDFFPLYNCNKNRLSNFENLIEKRAMLTIKERRI